MSLAQSTSISSEQQVQGSMRGLLERFTPIVTLRSMIILFVVVYLIGGPVAKESDIVAAMISLSLLGVIVVVGTVAVLRGVSIRSFLEPEISWARRGCANVSTLVSTEPGILNIRVPAFRIPPFFMLRVRLHFEQRGVHIPEMQLSGVRPAATTVSLEVEFPHRGEWRVRDVECEFGDQLGLTRINWFLPASYTSPLVKGHVVEVTVPTHTVETLPILSSSHREGDTVAHSRERKGDPFEIRPYQPSDGVRRIVWKIFARRRELVSRHPESAITPEGQVVVYCLANEGEDYVAADCLAYLRRLHDLELSIFFGCEGMEDSEIAQTPQLAEELLIQSVWRADPSNAASDVQRLIEGFRRYASSASLSRVVIFCGRNRVENGELRVPITEIGKFLAASGIAPVFVVREAPNELIEASRRRIDTSLSQKILRNLYFEPPATNSPEIFSGESGGMHELASLCRRYDWEVIV